MPRPCKRRWPATTRSSGTIEEHGGYVFKTVGDAFCAAFLTAPDALEAALESSVGSLASEWEQTGPLG